MKNKFHKSPKRLDSYENLIKNIEKVRKANKRRTMTEKEKSWQIKNWQIIKYI